MNCDLVNAHTQHVAIQFISYRGSMPALASYVQHSLAGILDIELDEITRYLQKPETHKTLLSYDVGLWKNSVGDWSLVSLATPPTIEGMSYRLDHFPTSNTCCRFCLQDAKRMAHIELVAEKDIHGEPVHRSLLHKICMKPWATMRTQVARAGVAS